VTNVFVSYRREDSSGWSGRLAQAMRDAFGTEQVFVDIATLEPGSDYAQVIEQRLASADVLLAVIGPRWLKAGDGAGRRLDDPQDLVRREVAGALRRRIKVIPVLVGGAAMPSGADLPEDLRELTGLQAHEMSDSRWDYDQGRLIDLLRRSGGRRPGFMPTGRARRRLYLGGAVFGAALVLGMGYLLLDGPLRTVVDGPGRSGDTAAELGLTGKLRPVPPGASVGSGAGGAGTVCCAVRDESGKPFLLTSEHVVFGSAGDPVYQPGRADGGDESARIGRIARILAPRPGMDATAAGSLIELASEMGATMTAPGLGAIRGRADPIVGERIRAVGRTSGLVEGSVIAVNESVPVRISPTESAGLEGMIRTSPISNQGDSGAPVVNDRGELIGFVYAGSADSSIVMPIQPVLDALGVRLGN
jgi:TIR domain